MGIISFYMARGTVLGRIVEHEISSLLAEVEIAVESEYKQVLALTRQLATDRHILRWAEEGFDPDQESVLVEKLQVLMNDFDLSRASWVDLESRRMWSQQGFLGVMEPDKNPWFFYLA